MQVNLGAMPSETMNTVSHRSHIKLHHEHIPTASCVQMPTGRIPPGSLITVGKHQVVIEKYLSEGGFAHVYLAKSRVPIDNKTDVVVKRIAVPDKENLSNVRNEVETMKKLRGKSRYIVNYIDSHASTLGNAGFEVFILMEYCSGGGIIDFMNKRLQTRLTEKEVLKIFFDVAQGVACMHYMKPPLVHRDLKVENVLISENDYKICDFGSCTTVTPLPSSITELRLLEEDVMKHTTLQYRPPEMIDVFSRKPLNEKADIWALGVFLYKLCYFTTPFENEGPLAILNVKYSFPSWPVYSKDLQNLIASLLQEHPNQRPNIYQVIKDVSHLRDVDVPIPNIYGISLDEQSQPTKCPTSSLSELSILSYAPQEKSSPYSDPISAKAASRSVDGIIPMRRGRPTKKDSEYQMNNSDSQGYLQKTVMPLRDSNISGTFDKSSTSDLKYNADQKKSNVSLPRYEKSDSEFSSSFSSSFDFTGSNDPIRGGISTQAISTTEFELDKGFESRFPSIDKLNIAAESSAGTRQENLVSQSSLAVKGRNRLSTSNPSQPCSTSKTFSVPLNLPRENVRISTLQTQSSSPNTSGFNARTMDTKIRSREIILDDSEDDDEDYNNGRDLDTMVNREQILSQSRASALEKLLAKEHASSFIKYEGSKSPNDLHVRDQGGQKPEVEVLNSMRSIRSQVATQTGDVKSRILDSSLSRRVEDRLEFVDSKSRGSLQYDSKPIKVLKAIDASTQTIPIDDDHELTKKDKKAQVPIATLVDISGPKIKPKPPPKPSNLRVKRKMDIGLDFDKKYPPIK